jgi:hypothetical protein
MSEIVDLNKESAIQRWLRANFLVSVAFWLGVALASNFVLMGWLGAVLYGQSEKEALIQQVADERIELAYKNATTATTAFGHKVDGYSAYVNKMTSTLVKLGIEGEDLKLLINTEVEK